MCVSHVFNFLVCVPRNLETGVAPLRAYQKTIQFRLKFRLIRSPETPQKPIQPEEGQNSVLVSGWIFGCILELLSGTNRSSGFMNPPERIQNFWDGRQVSFCTPLDQNLAVLSRDFHSLQHSEFLLSLTKTSSSPLDFHH